MIQTAPIQDRPGRAQEGLSIIVPVYNESEGLRECAAELRGFTASLEYPCEIMFVDDGSHEPILPLLNDDTFQCVRHEVNLGYGAAIKTGIQHTRYPNIVIIDADGTYPASAIQTLVDHLDCVDMAVGARIGSNAKIPWIRRPAKWMIRIFAQWMVRRSIPDLNSGLRAFRREEVEPILRLLPDGFSLTTTITIAFHANGKRVSYPEIEYRKRAGRSKFRPVADTWNMIMVILRTVVLLRPLNFFLPLSVLLAFAAFLVLIVSQAMGRFMDATFIVLMMTSIQMFVLGLVADLIVRVHLWTH
ncbi:MAG: glycosyltransferase [bacterium]|nr:glycosyltransferase [bacterium]